jgi:hypothetical protein
MPLNFRLFGTGKDEVPEVIEGGTGGVPVVKKPRRASRRRSLNGFLKGRRSSLSDEGVETPKKISPKPRRKSSGGTDSKTKIVS